MNVSYTSKSILVNIKTSYPKRDDTFDIFGQLVTKRIYQNPTNGKISDLYFQTKITGGFEMLSPLHIRYFPISVLVGFDLDVGRTQCMSSKSLP